VSWHTQGVDHVEKDLDRHVIVIVMVGLGGVAWAASAGTYSGKTSQKQGSIALTVKGGVVTRVKFVDGTGVGSGCQACRRGRRPSAVPP
jgi:hypothetical protein